MTCNHFVAGKYITIIKTGGSDRKSLFLCEVFAYPKPDERGTIFINIHFI